MEAQDAARALYARRRRGRFQTYPASFVGDGSTYYVLLAREAAW